MEMQFLTLLKDNNDWIDWRELWFDGCTEVDEPTEFPCYASSECFGYADLEVEDDCKGEAIFWPHFLYTADIEEMLERM